METNNIFIHNDAMEISVISACIFDPNIYFYVRDLLSKELFTVYECIKAYEAIKQLDDEGKTPNAPANNSIAKTYDDLTNIYLIMKKSVVRK